MGTSVDHLYRRQSVYWWQRRIPLGLRIEGPYRIARSLRTADPGLARRRARACSAAFDHVIMQFMAESVPARADLVRVLDTVFRRILEDGERTRADREAGPPPWTPEPQSDPRYEGVEPEKWDTVAYPPEQWMEEWRDAVVTNRQDDVRPMVTDALAANDLTLTDDTPEWRRLCRMALIVAARAHEINARREWGDYRDGWPQSAGVPPSELPGSAGGNATAAPTLAPPVQHVSSDSPPDAMLISESFALFTPTQTNWSAGYRRQADQALLLFISLMGDLPVNRITGDVAETFRNRLKALPAKHGKSIYAGMSPSQATISAERLREAMTAPGNVIQFGKQSLPRAQADMLSKHLTMKTVNKHLTMFTSWARWMEESETRGALLHRGKSPFTGKRFSKKEAKKEQRLAGRGRTAFPRESLVTMFGAQLFLDPPAMSPSNDADVQVEQAKFWSIPIGLYTGMRLGEISMLYPSDFRVEDGIAYIHLVSDDFRSFKSEAGDRAIPLHPDLIRLGLPDFAKRMAQVRSRLVFPGMKYKKGVKQRGANISKWFGRWRNDLGITSPRTPFHAFRNSFETALKNKFVGRDTLIDQIVGHEPESVGAKHYSDALLIPTKAEAINKIDYEIDLSLIIAALNGRRLAAE